MRDLYLGADHAGYKMKERVKKFLEKKNIMFEDLGTNSADPVDYPDYAKKVAKKVARKKGSRGILICRTGTGMAMAANKVANVRAAAAADPYAAKMSREDNDSNILALRSGKTSFPKTQKIINAWLDTDFSGKPRHVRRIKKLDKK